MVKPYPFSRFVRHALEAARTADVPIIAEGLRAYGPRFQLYGLDENDLFMWLDALEQRTPLRPGACREFPMFPECQSMDLAMLYCRLHALTFDEKPVMDWQQDQ